MKKLYFMLALALCGTMTSCFKDEPLNAEADIEQAYVHLENPLDVFFNKTDTVVDVVSTSTDIIFKIKNDADLTQLCPEFKVTEGATISPASGSAHDFSNGQVVAYTITSQDGQWKRTYNVSFRPYYTVTHYSFDEHIGTANYNDTKLYKDLIFNTWTENGYENDNYWASGNPGYAFNMGLSSKKTATPEDFPTSSADGGVSGKCVKLTTVFTSNLGKIFKMPIAAGNLYIGKFGEIAMSQEKALMATQFGKDRPFTFKPLRFNGWYKYTRGATYTDESYKEVADAVDTGDIYAILYRNEDADGKAVVLNGKDVLTNENIVAIARVDEIKETTEWIPFEVDFKYLKDIDEQALKNKGYNLTIVATSSKDGAFFKGAVGSTMYIDEFEITCDTEATTANK